MVPVGARVILNHGLEHQTQPDLWTLGSSLKKDTRSAAHFHPWVVAARLWLLERVLDAGLEDALKGQS